MPMFLLKTEPSEYSFDDLVREGRTVWSGVKAPAAQQALRAMKKGDEAFIYHTGDEKRIVGLARVTRGPFPDPADPPERSGKRVAVEIEVVKPVKAPVTLARIKGDKRFGEFSLVKQSRLSVMPVPEPLARVLRKWAGV